MPLCVSFGQIRPRSGAEIGPIVYNRAIADALAYFQGLVAHLKGVFTYWADSADRSGKSPKKGRG